MVVLDAQWSQNGSSRQADVWVSGGCSEPFLNEHVHVA